METKTRIYWSAFVFFLFSQISYATVYRVNNTGADADFTTAQAAHDGANAGDTLYFESSTIAYGALTVSKEIHIFGNGYFLGENSNLQANIAPASLTNFTLASGCDNSSIQGMTINTVLCLTNTTFSDVIIERNRILLGIYLSTNQDITNLYILRNYITGTHSTYQILRTGGSGLKTLVVSNNITSYGNIHSRITLDANTTATLKNNIFDVYFITSTFCTYKNNIFNISLNTPAFNEQDNTVEFNTCIATDCSSNNNNTNNAVFNNLFVGLPTAGTYTTDSRFELTPGSDASGSGEGGVDCGVYNGEVVYKLSGIPPIPSIYKLIAPSVVTGNFNITISTRSNN